MTPAHTRTIFTVFGVFALGVTANVALLQQPSGTKGSGPATQALYLGQAELTNPVTTGTKSRLAQVPIEQGPSRFARLRPDAAHIGRSGDKLPEAPGADGDATIVSAVQRALTAHGYGEMTADGVVGLTTRAAIMAYEFDHQMSLKGEASAVLLTRMAIGSVPGANLPPDPMARRVRSPQAELVMRTVQQSLATLNYQVGKIDGRNGDEFMRALREFEIDHGMKPSGRISAELVNVLAKLVTSAKPKPPQ